MKTATILSLKVGDDVRNESGTKGKVLHFTPDRVAIEWANGYAAAHTDAELAQLGVVKVSVFEAEDTTP